MSISRFIDDLNIIAGSSDDPKKEDGLSTPQFKSLFDKAGLLIQKFINEKLIPQIESAVDEEGLLSELYEVLNERDNANKQYARERFVVSDIDPASKSVLWFNTAPGGAVNYAAQVSLDENEQGYAVQATVGDEVYGVGNMTVNQGASGSNYDFTVR